MVSIPTKPSGMVLGLPSVDPGELIHVAIHNDSASTVVAKHSELVGIPNGVLREHLSVMTEGLMAPQVWFAVMEPPLDTQPPPHGHTAAARRRVAESVQPEREQTVALCSNSAKFHPGMLVATGVGGVVFV